MSHCDSLLIGIDLGTSNGKVACYDLDGNLHAIATRPIKTFFPRPGWFEQQPEDWLLALELSLIEVISQLGKKSELIKGISISNYGPGLVLVKDGKAIAPCPTWQDERSWDQGQRLMDEVGLDWIGFGVPQTGFPAKILWFIENNPKLISETEYIYDVKAFLIHWLTGIAATDPSSGSGSNGWHGPAFEFCGWPIERLPEIKGSTDLVSKLRDDLAEKVGLPKSVPVFTGLNDGASSTVGSGVVQLGESIITLATNGVVRVVIPERLESRLLMDNSFFSWPFVDDLWICGGSTLSGAGSLQWLANLIGIQNEVDAYSKILEEASHIPLGSKGVLFLPYLSGRGSPSMDPKLRGGFLHLGLEHGNAELIRALLEGISFALKEIFLQMKTLNLKVDSVHLTGGGARSSLWQQILSDVLETKIIHSGGDSTLGCAIVAAVGLGLYPNFKSAVENMVHPISTIIPDASRSIAYEQVFQYFQQTRDVLAKIPYPRWNWEDS